MTNLKTDFLPSLLTFAIIAIIGVVWGITALVDSDANGLVWGRTNAHKDQINAFIGSNDCNSAILEIAAAQIEGYRKYLDERKEYDDFFKVTHLIPKRPRLLIAGVVKQVNNDQVSLVLKSNEDEINYCAYFKDDKHNLKEGDFVVLKGTGKNLEKYSFRLHDAAKDAVGVEHFWD